MERASTRSRLKAGIAALLVLVCGIVVGVQGTFLFLRYAIQSYLHNVPEPGLEFVLLVIRNEYKLNDLQVSTLRTKTQEVFDELTINNIPESAAMDRRVLKIARDFSRDLNAEQARKLERDLLFILRVRRVKLLRQLYLTLELGEEQILKIDDMFAAGFNEAKTKSPSVYHIPETLVRDHAEEIRKLLNDEQIPKFNRFLETLLPLS